MVTGFFSLTKTAATSIFLEIAAEWGMCSTQVKAQMQEMGISADEWSQQMGQAWDDFNAEGLISVDWWVLKKAALARAA